MRLRNILITVKDMERAKHFYKEVFGLDEVMDAGSNVMLTQGLVLQDISLWEETIRHPVLSYANATALFFETPDIEQFMERLNSYNAEHTESFQFVNVLQDNGLGRRSVRFYDPEGNLLEVGTPISR